MSAPLLLGVEVGLIHSESENVTPAEAISTRDVPKRDVCNVASEKAVFNTPSVSRIPVEVDAMIILTASGLAYILGFDKSGSSGLNCSWVIGAGPDPFDDISGSQRLRSNTWGIATTVSTTAI